MLAGYHQFDAPQKKPKKSTKPKPYDTPQQWGIKWQCDVKYVPKHCAASSIPSDTRFYQYTMIDEASRERFIYHYDEHSSYTSCEFVKRALLYFGYPPKIIQTDNGFEFTHGRQTDKIHPFDILLNELGIKHQLIRPRTPRHNGKVERSHRKDTKRFYQHLSFYSLEDLRKQAKAYLKRSNNTAMATLNYLTPIEKRILLLSESSS